MENTTQPLPPPSQETPADKTTRWKVWAIITVVLITVLTSSLYFYVLKLPFSSPTAHAPTPTSIEKTDLYTETNRSATANWKLYTNEKLSFSLKYPEEWYLNEIKAGEPLGLYFNVYNPTISTISPNQPIGIYTLKVINMYPNYDQCKNSSVTCTDIKIGNDINAKRYELPAYSAIVVFVKDNYIFEFQSKQFDEHSQTVKNILQSAAKQKELFDQILSTFKFLDQEQTSLNGSGSSTSNNLYSDTYFSVEVPALLYASPQLNTKINGGYEVVTFANKLPYFSVQVTPDTPSMHNAFPSDKQIEFGGLQATLSPVIAGVWADIYQPTIILFAKNRAYVITVGIQDTKENREIADQFIQQLSKTFKVL